MIEKEEGEGEHDNPLTRPYIIRVSMKAHWKRNQYVNKITYI